MDEVVISWTFENWLTVFLMAITGLVALGLLSAAFHKARGNGGANAAAS